MPRNAEQIGTKYYLYFSDTFSFYEAVEICSLEGQRVGYEGRVVTIENEMENEFVKDSK